MSLTKKFEAVDGIHAVKVYRDSEYKCFVVKCYTDGNIVGTNEQDTLESAIGTARCELKFMVDHIPSDTDLAYLDEQASIMAAQYNLPSGDAMEAKEVDIVWSEAVTFVSNAEEMPNKQYRLVMFIAGHDVEGPWADYHAAVFKVEALRLARAGVGFSVEFK